MAKGHTGIGGFFPKKLISTLMRSSQENLRYEQLESKAGQNKTLQDIDCSSYKKLSGSHYYWVLTRRPGIG